MSLTFPRRAQRGPCRQSRMRGGAFLGLILGLIIGLAVALVVAMYVAKVPIPFVNSALPVSNNGQDAAEDQKNRNWNPNATLETHGPAAPASDAGSAASSAQPAHNAPPQQPVAVPPPVEVAQPVPPSPATANAPAPVSPRAPVQQPAQAGAGEASSGDMLGDFAAARVRADNSRGASANAPQAQDVGFTYFVQTGAFRTPQDADAERARLSLLGMEAAITEMDQAGRPVYRVRIGPFQNKTAADQISARLASNGFNAALVRVAR